MSAITPAAAAALVAEIRALARQAARRAAGDVRRVASGRVERRDADGTWYVAIDGAAAPTPVNGDVLADVQVGHRVSVRVEGTRLSIVGNATEPAQGSSAVEAAVSPVRLIAQGALRESDRASDAAARANDSAAAAQASADDATASAANAAEAATSARTSADSALYQLSVVEDVMGTAEWLAAHATYAATEDASVTPGKTYYALTGGDYLPVAVSEVTYSQTEDATPQEGTTYYVLTDGEYVEADVSGGFAQGTTYYVASPTSPAALGLYEASVSEAVQHYVASHLALTDDGLWLALDDSAYRMRLSATGWEVVGPDGQPVHATQVDGQGHVTTTIGRLDGLHVTVTENRLAFSYPNGGETVEVAWIEVDPTTGASSFRIANAVVMRELRLGSWKWYDRAGGNLALKWIGA